VSPCSVEQGKVHLHPAPVKPVSHRSLVAAAGSDVCEEDRTAAFTKTRLVVSIQRQSDKDPEYVGATEWNMAATAAGINLLQERPADDLEHNDGSSPDAAEPLSPPSTDFHGKPLSILFLFLSSLSLFGNLLCGEARALASFRATASYDTSAMSLLFFVPSHQPLVRRNCGKLTASRPGEIRWH
jgi:hypothetical protein